VKNVKLSPYGALLYYKATPLGWVNFLLRRATRIKHPLEVEEAAKQKKE